MDVATQNEIRILNIPGRRGGQADPEVSLPGGSEGPANTYKGQTAEVSTVAVNAVLIAGSSPERGDGLQPDQGPVREPG